MKMMKKLLAVLMAVFLLASPAMALEQTPSLAGEWTMTQAMASGMALTPEMLGWSMSFVLNTDGTGKFSSNVGGANEEHSISWTQAGNMVTINDPTTGEVTQLSLQADGTLRAAVDQTLMYFTRTAAAPQTSTVPGGTTPGGSQQPPSGGTTPGGGLLPPTDGTTTANGFEGTWVVTQATMDGQTINTSEEDIQMIVTFNAGGTATVSDGYDTASCTWTQNGSTASVTDSDGYVTVFTMQANGTITGEMEGLVLTLERQGGSAAVPSGIPSGTPSTTPAAAGQTVTGNGYTLQVPQGWVEINDATVQQLVQTYGQQAVDSAGLTQQLQQVKTTGALLYYAADFNSSVNVVKENANGVTMDTLLSLESSYAAAFANAGMTNYKMGGPVEFSGNTYYTGTFDAAYPTMQYYQIVNGMFYTITLTNVADANAATILGSFTVTG